jgi:hypothetical protein
MYLVTDEDLHPLIADDEDGSAVLVLYWTMEHLTDGVTDCEEGEEEQNFLGVEYSTAGELIPAVEHAMREGVSEVIYGLLPADGETDEPDVQSVSALGREPIADFLARLQERKAQEDQAGHN